MSTIKLLTMYSLKERRYLPIKEEQSLVEVTVVNTNGALVESPAGTVTSAVITEPEVKGFFFTQEGLVKILSDVKYSGEKTIHDFLKKRGIKYL